MVADSVVDGVSAASGKQRENQPDRTTLVLGWKEKAW